MVFKLCLLHTYVDNYIKKVVLLTKSIEERRKYFHFYDTWKNTIYFLKCLKYLVV